MGKHNVRTTDDIDKIARDIAGLPAALRAAMYDRGLEATGKIMIKAQRESIENEELTDTEQLRDSIAVINRGPHSIDVGPTGQRTKKSNPKKLRRYTKSSLFGSNKRYTTGLAVRNAEVGFIVEYGTDDGRVKKNRWMEKALDRCEDELLEAVTDIYDEIVRKIFQEG